VMRGARNRVRTRHIQLVDVLGLSGMAEFACWPAGAPGDSALSTHPCGVFLCDAGMDFSECSLCKYIPQMLCKVVPQVLG
jgi:hypothetical protein